VSLWNWLNTNTGAVQAMAAVVTTVLTAVLLGVTARYVVLTRRMLESNEAAARADFMPDINASIELTHPRKDEVAIKIKNSADPPFCILRARLLGGSVFKWSDTLGVGPPFTSEVKFGPSDGPTLKSVLLRKTGATSGVFKLVPLGRMGKEEWLKLLDYRISIAATVVIEVSDITGRISYSFTVRLNPHTGGTNIQTRYPSIFESEVV